MAVTTSMPWRTRPKAVYLPSSDGVGAVTMKNDVVALSGSSPRAMLTTPASCSMALNSPLTVPTTLRCTWVSGTGRDDRSPAWTANFGTTRWNPVPS